MKNPVEVIANNDTVSDNPDITESTTTTALHARDAEPKKQTGHHGEPAQHTHDTLTDNYRTETGAATDSLTGNAAMMAELGYPTKRSVGVNEVRSG